MILLLSVAFSGVAIISHHHVTFETEDFAIRVDPWCDNSLRVRVAPLSTGVLDNEPGALGISCPPTNATTAVHSVGWAPTSNSLTNGALTARWSDTGGFAFYRQGDEMPVLETAPGEGMTSAFSLAPASLPPPSPSPGPFACQDSCTLGATGVQEKTDADGCVAAGKLINVTRDACCSACVADGRCEAWSWGRDNADPKHRHNCYLCSGLQGTISRNDRDFGCVERLHNDTTKLAFAADVAVATPAAGAEPPHPAAPPPPPPATQYYKTGALFASNPDEVVIGLGQHSEVNPTRNCSGGGGACGQWKLNNKGMSWMLGIKKFFITVPFYTSSRGYGFLWNHPGDGLVQFKNNSTLWNCTMQRQIDFWVTVPPAETAVAEATAAGAGAGGGARGRGGGGATGLLTATLPSTTYASILHQYVDATGHAPLLPDSVTGFWQSKMRYRTPDELLDVAQGWTKFGDFKFNPVCWPNVSDAVKVLKSQNVRLLRSTYPWVDTTSVNYQAAVAKGVLAFDNNGKVAHPATGGDALIDATNPAARRFVWELCKESFFYDGIEMFWLDDAEPNLNQAGLVYHCGPAEYCGALWPNNWIQTFVDGLKESGVESPVQLSRAGWAGFQKTGAVLWSSDIPSTFESLQVQIRAGLNYMMSGGAWWTTDVGGFFGGNSSDPYFKELLVRWYQFGALCPIFRTHGDRSPAMAPLPPKGPRYGEPGDECTTPDGHASGGSNEIWSYGNVTEALLHDIIRLRESLRPYISQLAANVSATGAPPMRPLFYDFPNDAKAWNVEDSFMFGTKYLVAPVLEYGARNRTVYFPGERTVVWQHYFTSQHYTGGQTAVVAAPLDQFPLFVRS